MDNEEILLNLNAKTKKYFDDAFSYLDYFTNHSELYSKYDEDDKFAYSFLLSTLKNDKKLIEVFADYNITFESVCNYLGIKDIEMSESEKTDYVQHNKLESFFSNISSRIKYNNYLKDTNVSLIELHTHQIFDFISDYYFDSLKDLFENMGLDNVDSTIYDVCKKIYDIDSNPNRESELYYSRDFYFEECTIVVVGDEVYISFDRDFNFPGALISGEYYDKKTNTKTDLKGNTDTLVCKNRYRITKINSYDKFDETTIEKLFNYDNMLPNMTIHLVDINDDSKTLTMELNTEKAFVKPLENKNQRVLHEMLKLNDFYKEEHGGPMVKTPYLDSIGIDLTRIEYLKDPSVDREEELKAIEKILLYPEKDTSIMVIGQAGCGKTALIKGLAYRVQKGKVPKALKNIRIISLNCADLVAGTKYVGTLEKKMQTIIKEASASKDIILFLDSIHQAIGAGKIEGSNNTVSEILKNHMGIEDGGIRVIGATTIVEYDKYISSDPSFETRFKLLKINEPDETVIYSILNNLINAYNKFCDAKLLLEPDDRDKLIRWLIETTCERNRDKRVSSSNPRLVLDIVKDAYARACLDSRDEVTYDDFKLSVLQEERLWPSCRDYAIKKLDHIQPKEFKNNIINFSLARKKVVK